MADTQGSVEAAIVKMINNSGVQGVPMDVLKDNFGKYGPAFQGAMQSLIYATSSRKITPFTRQGVPCYRMASLGAAVGGKGKQAKINALPEVERAVLDVVKVTDNKGLWIRDLQANLKHKGYTPAVLMKAMKRLEKDQIIKTVVTNRKKKVLMLFHLEPHESLVGGTWFSEETKEFDSEFVQAVYKAVFQFVKDHDTVTLAGIERAISSSDAAKKPLSAEDITSIIRILIFDNRLVEIDASSGQKYYQLATQFADWHPFTETPCASCPLQSQCDSSGSDPFNPQTCPFIGQWLS